TISLRLTELDAPSIVAERLPKALIHRNVPGERIHALLVDLDRAWASAAPLGVYGPVQRWQATVASVRDAAWPVLDTPPLGGRARWRLGELSLPWDAVAPTAGGPKRAQHAVLRALCDPSRAAARREPAQGARRRGRARARAARLSGRRGAGAAARRRW